MKFHSNHVVCCYSDTFGLCLLYGTRVFVAANWVTECIDASAFLVLPFSETGNS